MKNQNRASLLKNNGWKQADTTEYEKKNKNGYVFRAFLDGSKEWWCKIYDENQGCRGIVYVPSVSRLESLFKWYEQ